MKKNILLGIILLFLCFNVYCQEKDTIDIIKKIEPQMIFVEGGTFYMGCTSEQGGDCSWDESPVRKVTLSNFYISKYEITQKQWQVVMNATPSKSGQWEDYPVTNISWYEVQEFCQKLNEMTGKKYRLPTEAEWEYAARGGNKSKGFKFSGSDNLDNIGWFATNCQYDTHPVGQKEPNELGIYDMSGNVWEWCSDFFAKYPSKNEKNPQGPSQGKSKIFRGGSWRSHITYCRNTIRNYFIPTNKSNTVGFRLVLSE
ncbi:MAG: formylglycine-generating enzyme family protein [Bacteroidales bacterium]|jgi:formylglycine-generating enzyme required for sulfatase activity|nr:formylglycine-generating enzyme family protein [Bacteroidales bacterium]